MIAHHITDIEKDTPFIRELIAFLAVIEDDAAVIYNADSWRQRGEKYGNEESMVYTVTTDGGGLQMLLNPGYAVDTAWVDRLTRVWHKFLERHGLRYELGQHWTVHLYDTAKKESAA